MKRTPNTLATRTASSATILINDDALNSRKFVERLLANHRAPLSVLLDPKLGLEGLESAAKLATAVSALIETISQSINEPPPASPLAEWAETNKLSG